VHDPGELVEQVLDLVAAKTFDDEASPTEISPTAAARATSQLSSSLTRNTAVTWPISSTTSGRSTTRPWLPLEHPVPQPLVRPAGPSNQPARG